jgi:hypothetical protein
MDKARMNPCPLLGRNHVDLVDDNQSGLACKLFTVLFQFAAEQVIRLNRVGIGRTAVNQKQQNPAAFDVGQELVAKAATFGGSFDKSWDIGKCDALTVWRECYTQIRGQRREGIVGNLRVCCRKFAEQCALARVRKADNANVAKDLQAQPDPTFLRGDTLFAVPRGTVDGCGKRRITSATASAMGYRDSFALVDQIRQDFL